MSRTIVIGDIHGCFDELVSLLDSLAFAVTDRVVSVGDLIVKGNKSKEVLDLFAQDARFHSVLGNHDRALLRFWEGAITTLKRSQIHTCNELEADKEQYRTYLGSLPLKIDLGSHLVVHAGVRPGVPLDSQSVEDLTELRTLGEDRTSREGVPWYDVYDSEKLILFGHWPSREPRLAKRAIGLDTGCVYGNRLTAYVLETGEFTSVQAKRAYDPPKTALA
ncbi:MAG: metallophosphoesterase [Pyrinomonadaceae bacterium]